MHPDRGHFHHRLIDMGLSQKQAVAVLYSISAILGLAAVVITTSGELRALILILGFCLCAFLWVFIYKELHKSENASAQHELDEADKNPHDQTVSTEEQAPASAALPQEKREDEDEPD